ncbi:MAG: HAD family hydrolase [Planctomycetes bacterium]|nr:HAD family hydrolase [Planctomycetota bacterium]
MNIVTLAEMRPGKPGAVLFDFDGTLSTLRAGWEETMAPVMVEVLTAAPGSAGADVEEKVADYIERNTGTRTILQMEWLADEVGRLGGEPLDATAYKRLYLDRLMKAVGGRLEALESGSASPRDYLMEGASEFLGRLSSAGIPLYLASGTDEPDVRREAAALGLTSYFDGGIYGARDSDRDFDKDRVIRQIADERDIRGPELVVFGDGPVEIRFGREAGGRTVGVAGDESKRGGWDMAKVRRLKSAGAQLLIPGYTEPERLLEALT